jgi:hypothetical protein
VAADAPLNPQRVDDEVPFGTVLDDELAAIGARRAALEVPRGNAGARGTDTAENRAWDMRLLGLSFSGGGIRSATFNLGVLQTLAALGLLKHVDYLSTVSGGGYIGTWLAALAQRTFACAPQGTANAETEGADQGTLPFDNPGYTSFEQRLAWTAGDEHDAAMQPHDAGREHAAIRFLREFSNYLTPKLGIFSGDTWALFSIYLRNALLNQLVLVCALATLVLCIPHLLSLISKTVGAAEPGNVLGIGTCIAIFAVGFVLVSRNLGRNLAGIRDADRRPPNPHSSSGIIGWILIPLLIIGVTVPNWLPVITEAISQGSRSALHAHGLAALIGALVSGVTWSSAWWAARRAPWKSDKTGFWKSIVGWSFVSGAIFGIGMYWAGWMIGNLAYAGSQLVIAPPLFALGVLTAGVLHVGLAGRGFGQQYNEWLSRLGGLMLVGALAWLGITGLLLISPLLVDLVAESALASTSFGLGWIVTTASAVLVGKRSDVEGSSSVAKRLLMAIAPWVFIVGLLILLAAGVHAVLHGVQTVGRELPPAEWTCSAQADYQESIALQTAKARYQDCLGMFVQSEVGGGSEAGGGSRVDLPVLLSHYLRWLDLSESAYYLIGLIALAVLLTWVLSRRIDINSFSLHNMYANRLVRCYLGASVRNRWGNPFSGFSAADDLKLGAVACKTHPILTHLGADVSTEETQPIDASNAGAYPGPYPIINTAINLVSGRNLAFQERKAASFVLSPLYCGYHRAGARGDPFGEGACDAYRSSLEYSSIPRNLTLGEAMATSGAAASPNMGYHSSPAFSFLMGIFNIRLGRWAGNPYASRPGSHSAKHVFLKEAWKQSGPRFALWHLLREVFGLTDSENSFVYLSDGGHFENLGIYELVRRRCRYIIACDGGADPDYRFEDLANAIRKCRIDFGVEIEIDVKQIATIDADRCSSTPCAVGRIRYSHDRIGTLLYIKASRRRGLPSDVMHYASEHPEFPHEKTADQFFSESQFESYRRLGYFLATEVLAAARDDRSSGDHIDNLFRRLGQHWHPSSASVKANFSRLTSTVDALFERLRQSPANLGFLNHQFFPEWRGLLTGEVVADAAEAAAAWTLPSTEPELREGFYFCSSLIQLMENVYLDLDLESEWRHPDNSGWMNLFRHWTWSSMFRVTWAITAAMYGGRFRNFCRQRLDMKLGRVAVNVLAAGEGGSRRSVAELLENSGFNLIERQQIRSLLGGQRLPDDSAICELRLEVETPLGDDGIPPEQRYLRVFVFGYAVVTGDELLMFRVQDHLRNMELGRQGLVALVECLERGANLRVAPEDELILKRLKAIGESPLPGQIAEFRSLLDTIVEDHSSVA